jgi:hypothetical protein
LSKVFGTDSDERAKQIVDLGLILEKAARRRIRYRSPRCRA